MGLYISNTFEGALIGMEELFERGSLFNLAKMIVSVLQNYKELECKVEKVHNYDRYNHCDPWIIAIIWKPLFSNCSGRSDRKKNQRRGVCDSPLLVVCGGP